jgi:hypothetical protein
MRIYSGFAVWAPLVVALVSAKSCPAETSHFNPIRTPLAELVAGQEMFKLPVCVVDPGGKPVAHAKVTPWALRSSQGHGPWDKEDKRAGVGPQDFFTDDDGNAVVLYPHYRDVKEQIRTLAVSLFIDHPDFAYVDSLHIDVPLESAAPYEVKLEPGVPVEARPLIDGKQADLENLFAFWSDGRSWKSESALQKTADGSLRFSAMRPGKNSILLVMLDGDHATHFSKITDFELKAGQPAKIDIPLEPSLRVHGVLSEVVPRPVRQGRIKLETLSPNAADTNRVGWFSWAPVESDGTFTIDAWPADEALQLIAVCDGYVATSGKAPEAVEHPPDPAHDSFGRPQVFMPRSDEQITVAMMPMARCEVTAEDERGDPAPGVKIFSFPNVGWWNSGSQIYCDPLVRGERTLRNRNYYDAADKQIPQPFEGETDSQGKLTLEIPAGHERLTVHSDLYELPVFLGGRYVRIDLAAGATTTATLHLQPNGTDKLGEWDQLAGVVFGCSTREGRQICALPGVRQKMDEFTERFRAAKDQQDPKLLAEAYATVADAFAGVGDQDEAAKWRQKAADQAAKAQASEQPSSK